MCHTNNDPLPHLPATITLDEAMQPLGRCIGHLEDSIQRAEALAAKYLSTDQKKAARLLEYATSQEMQLSWLLNYWEAIDFDEAATIGEAMVAYAIYLSRLDLQPPASDAPQAKVQAWKDAVSWVISDDDSGPLSLAKAAPVLRLDPTTLRANLLREAGLPQIDQQEHAIVATAKSAGTIIRSAFARRRDRTQEQSAEVAAAMERSGLQPAGAMMAKELTTKMRAFKAHIKAVAEKATTWLIRFARTAYPIGRNSGHSVTATVIALALPFAAGASGPAKRDLRQSNEASSQVALPAYVLQAAAYMKPTSPAEEQVQACVGQLAELAPGGGDVLSQQQSVAREIPAAKIMMAGLQAAASMDETAGRCNWHLTNHQILLQDRAGLVAIGRDARPIPWGFRDGASKQVGRGLLCSIALGDLAPTVVQRIRSQALSSEIEAVGAATEVLRTELKGAVARAFAANPEVLSVPVLMSQGNLGSVRPYTPVTPGSSHTKDATANGEAATEVIASQVSSLAQQSVGISEFAVGGLKAWTTEPTQAGFVAKFDGATYSISRRGVAWFDSSTLGGDTMRVSISTSGSYASNAPALAGREQQLERLSVCALSMNNVALQLAPALMRPAAVPLPSSLATQALLRKADMGQALNQARAVIAGQVVQTDYSESGLRWRIGSYTFAKNGGASRSGVQVTLNGAVLFDDSHAGGRAFTLSTTNSDSNSTGYFFKR